MLNLKINHLTYFYACGSVHEEGLRIDRAFCPYLGHVPDKAVMVGVWTKGYVDHRSSSGEKIVRR